MHFLCRVSCRALASRFPRATAAAPLLRGRVRQMSSGGVPGSSGENLIYYLLVAGATGAGGYYAYRTVTSDKARYNERIEDIQQRTTAEWKPKPWPPQSIESDEMETNEVSEANEEAKPAATEETEAQNEREAVPVEAENGEKSPNVEATSDVQEEHQEASVISDAAQTEGTPDVDSDSNVESSQENLQETQSSASLKNPEDELLDK